MRHGVWKKSAELFSSIPQTGRNHAFLMTKALHSKRKTTTKTTISRKADIENNIPHIILHTWDLGVDLVRGNR